MCSLCGVAGDITIREEKVFKSFLIFGSLRGMDSTGAASISRTPINGAHETRVAKELGPFPYLFDTKRFDRLFHGTQGCLLGHNRSKTIGDLTIKSAHPFAFSDIIGAHNGTIDTVNKNRMNDGSSFRTDSEAIFNNIQEEGIEETIKKIDQTEAYALTWYDKRDHTINFIRNDKRPLYIAFAGDKKLLFWASTHIILMAGMLNEEIQADNKQIHFLTADTYYKYKIPTGFSDRIEEVEKRKLENRKFQPYNYSYGGERGKKIDGFSRDGSSYTPADDDETGEMAGYYGSRYFASKYEPVSKASETVFAESLKKLDEIKDVPAKVLSVTDVVKKRAWEHAETGNIVPKFSTDNPVLIVYQDSDTKLYYYSKIKKFSVMKYDNVRKEWSIYNDLDKAPIYVDFNRQDINSRHIFKHKGHRENKQVFYKGFRKLLTPEEFTKIMAKGCLNCDRHPEWGNKVIFVTNKDDFVCEYCGLNPDIVEAGKSLNEEKEVA